MGMQGAFKMERLKLLIPHALRHCSRRTECWCEGADAASDSSAAAALGAGRAKGGVWVLEGAPGRAERVVRAKERRRWAKERGGCVVEVSCVEKCRRFFAGTARSHRKAKIPDNGSGSSSADRQKVAASEGANTRVRRNV